jgi:hypothetical protein
MTGPIGTDNQPDKVPSATANPAPDGAPSSDDDPRAKVISSLASTALLMLDDMAAFAKDVFGSNLPQQ